MSRLTRPTSPPSRRPCRPVPPRASATRRRRWPTSTASAASPARYRHPHGKDRPPDDERILEATEGVLRRHGPAKATVVDVARALGVGHGSVYRNFRTKAALREAVTERWLDRMSASLSGIVFGTEAPEAKLRHWPSELFAAKRRKVGDAPELFATYMVLVGESSAAVDRHVADLTGQLAQIVREGAERGDSRWMMRRGR